MLKTILITGGSSRISQAMARRLSDEGHSVIVGVCNTTGNNACTARRLAALPNIEVVDLDVTRDHSVDNAISAVLAKYGHIDVLINSAGVSASSLPYISTSGQVKGMLEVNLFGAVRTSLAVLPAMQKDKCGLIINMPCPLVHWTMPFLLPDSFDKTTPEDMHIDASGIEVVNVQCEISLPYIMYSSGFMKGVANGVHTLIDMKQGRRPSQCLIRPDGRFIIGEPPGVKTSEGPWPAIFSLS